MAKRANGEGTIYQRADGRWCAALTGDRGRRKYVYGTNRREVARKLASAMTDRDNGLPMVEERQTVGEYLQVWLESVRPTLRDKTYVRYEGIVRRYVTPELGRQRLARLTPQRVQQLYSKLLQDGLAPASVRQVHAVIHKALNQAVQWDVVPRNVSDRVTRPRVGRTEMRTLSVHEAKRFLEAAEGERLRALYVLALTTGMRQGELLGLRWRDVDMEAGRLHVRVALQRTAEGLDLVEPKTAGSRRAIRLSDDALSALRDHRAEQAAEREAAAEFWEDRDLVFCTELGTPIDAGNLVHRSFARVLARAGLPHMRFHDLRHSAATLLMGEGVHPKIVSEMLGHSQIGITLDLYSHATPTMHEQATEAMNRIFAR